MKVLYTVVHGEVAGGQIVCLGLVERLLRAGHQALAVSPSEGSFTELLRKRNVPVFIIPFEKTYSFHRAFQLLNLVRKEQVDLIHTHGTVPMNVHARIAAKLASIPCISHMHAANVFNAHPLIRRYQVFLDNWTSHFCDRLIAVSKATKESLVQQGISPGRVEVIPNGINCDRLKSSKSREEVFRQFHIDPAKRLIGSLGRLCPTKGLEEFLEAAKQVNDQLPDVAWMIVGEDIEFGGTYERKLRMRAEELGLNGQVIFTGHQVDPFSLINAWDLFVHPSWGEGMPLVILEAMALKKVVIASAVGGVPEVVQNDETGILVPPKDPHALSQAVLKVLKNSELARTMGEAAFQRVRTHFSESATTGRVLEMYKRLER